MPLTSEFKQLKKNVKKTYLGKQVPKQYQGKYGKRYNPGETTSIAYAIAKSRRIKIH